MSYFSDELRKAVIARAANHCEYCRLSQDGQEATFHIDHVVPIAVGGQTEIENLALACSLRKGARVKTADATTGAEVQLFNPRIDKREDQFHWDGVLIVGKNPVGRATIEVLKMNREQALSIREEESKLSRHPFTKP
ncbi:MAG: HNH endonuclease [Ignavibacteriae bacterium]|nr:HNH endonuclease [Ignavibacteriota bacterium]